MTKIDLMWSTLRLAFAASALLLCASVAVLAQSPAVAGPLLKRSSIKTERRELNYGGRLTLLGAPTGDITIEAWKNNEVEITAEIEVQATTEADLTLLGTVTGFAITEDMNSIIVVTTGTHDKGFMKKNAKSFPKRLWGLPWSVTYHIRVPQQCDLDINGGRGKLNLSAVEGAISLKAQEGDATLNMTGGDMIVAVGIGTVNFNILSRGWRGRGAEIQVVTGSLNVTLPPAFNAYINADILRLGQIENTYAGLKPRPRTTATPKSITGRAGTGGALLSLKVGDGTLRIAETPTP
jgi:hypothetical protein